MSDKDNKRKKITTEEDSKRTKIEVPDSEAYIEGTDIEKLPNNIYLICCDYIEQLKFYIEGTNIVRLPNNIYSICCTFLKQLNRKVKQAKLAELRPLLKRAHQKNLLISYWANFIKTSYKHIRPRLAYQEHTPREEIPFFLSDNFLDYKRLFDSIIKAENKTEEKISSLLHELHYSLPYREDRDSWKIEANIVDFDLGFEDFANLKSYIIPTEDFVLFLQLQKFTCNITAEELKSGTGSWIREFCTDFFHTTGNRICKFCKFEPLHKDPPKYLRKLIYKAYRYIIEFEHILELLNKREDIKDFYQWDRLERSGRYEHFEEYSLSDEE